MADEGKGELPLLGITKEELENRFSHHEPNERTVYSYDSVRGWAMAFADVICRVCPDCRERSMALANVEKAMFWTNAGIARRTP